MVLACHAQVVIYVACAVAFENYLTCFNTLSCIYPRVTALLASHIVSIITVDYPLLLERLNLLYDHYSLVSGV